MTKSSTAAPEILAPEAPPALTQIVIDQRVFDLYDEYCHGGMDRREFLAKAAAVTIGRLKCGALASRPRSPLTRKSARPTVASSRKGWSNGSRHWAMRGRRAGSVTARQYGR